MPPKVTLFPFQKRVVDKVLDDLRGNAIIADEVGLGKTIEAGELIHRILQRDAGANLVVCVPKGLLFQWRAELLHKFNILLELEEELSAARIAGRLTGWRVLLTHTKLALLDAEHPFRKVEWDLVVVDEAHRFSNPAAKRYKTLREMNRRRTVLLTATPVQNSLADLFVLSELVREGSLSHSASDFMESFALDKKGLHVKPSRRQELHDLTASFLTRTTRREAGISFPPRDVRSTRCQPEEWEADFAIRFAKAMGSLAAEGRLAKRGIGFGRAQLLQGLSSHPRAALETMDSMASVAIADDIAMLESIVAAGRPTAKMQNLWNTIRTEGKSEQWLVFVERLATGLALKEYLGKKGPTVEFYQGALDSGARERMISAFRQGSTQVLVSTSAGAEGLNLQNCHNLVNFDLHWNPLRIEQRIGRIHRMGQTQMVRIYNLVTKGSIDEVILDRLYTKLDLFNATVGEVASILSNLEDDFDVEDEIRRALDAATDMLDLGRELERVGRTLSEKFSRERRAQANQPF